MQIVRVFSGDDGESHFEDLTTDQFRKFVALAGEGSVDLISRASPSFSDFHTAPRRQYVVMMAGTVEFENADGTKRRLAAGDVLVAEDMTGRGHLARGIGPEQRVMLAVPLPD